MSKNQLSVQSKGWTFGEEVLSRHSTVRFFTKSAHWAYLFILLVFMICKVVVTSDSMNQDAVFVSAPAGCKLECFFGVKCGEPMFGFSTLCRVKVINPAPVPFRHEVAVNFSFYDVESWVGQVALEDLGFLVCSLSTCFG